MRFRADDLAGERGGEAVFSGVTFDLSGGDMLVVTGPNGSGKSTLLRMLAGLLEPAGGTLALEGGERWPEVASAVHYLGDQNAMKPALAVGDNLTFWREFQGEPRLTVEDALDAVGLAHTLAMPFSYLSTGQKRRAAIARLLVSYRPIWLLDEPTAGLDKASEVRIARLIDAHRREDGIVIAATHIPLGVDGVKGLELGG